MENISQYADGTTAFVNAKDSVKDLLIGGGAATTTVPRYINERVAVLALGVADTAGGVFAWSPGEVSIVTRVVLHVKTVASGAGTLDVGVAANATTSSDLLLDGVDVHSATGIFDNVLDGGTDGKSRQLVSATQYITGSKATGNMAALAGFVYIHYHPAF